MRGIALIPPRHHKLQLLPLRLEEDMEEAIADEEATKDVVASVLQPTELPRAISAEGQTTTLGIVRLRL